MGKNTKRKQRRKQNQHHDNEVNNETDSTHTGPMIVSKLRHNDPKIRHAALAALVHTSNSMQNTSIIQAVRDQLMDRTHVACASMAAACLSNFLANGALEHHQQYHTLTAGWLLLLVERLRDCYTVLESDPTTTTAAVTLSSTQRYLYWELADRCWTCLVHLVENNPLVMERLLRSVQVRQDTMKLIFQYMLMSWRTNTTTISSNTTATVVDSTTEIQPLIHAIQIMSSRCLHSIWDDNVDFITAWVNDDSSTVSSSLEMLITFLQSSSSSSLGTARLHVVGAWCAFWTWTQAHSYEWPSTIPQPLIVIRECLTILRQTLQWDTSTRSMELSQLMTLYQLHQQNQADEMLEQQIVSEQEKKNEPAKLIARRLKKMKEEKGTSMKEEDDDDEEQQVKDAPMEVMEWDTALEQWMSSIRPLQLALEITANLTSSGVFMVIGNNEDADDEDELMEDNQPPAVNVELVELLLETSLPNGLVDFMKNLYQPLWDNTTTKDFPKTVRNSIGELQSKVAVCVGHCVTGLHQKHRSWDIDMVGLWDYLKQAWHTAVDDNAIESVCAMMAISLQSTKGHAIAKSLELKDIELLLHQLRQTKSVMVARDIICMLGSILSNSSDNDSFRFHTPEVNEVVARTLLEIGTTDNPSPVILSEILSVLMDIYGDDDCYPQIFDNLHILGYFQKAVPALKQVMNLSRDANLEDIEQWKETASNASRFIQYKKGYSE